MIAFLNEDHAYVYWVTHHRGGFVLDCQRRPTKNHVTLHRATCPQIKQTQSKRTHWTTGRKMKACSLDMNELTAWSIEQSQGEPTLCPECHPAEDPAMDPENGTHLTKLTHEILSFVLEIATNHMDDSELPYRLDVSMIARCYNKTPGQLQPVLKTLLSDGLITLSGKLEDATRCLIFPTEQAIRTLPEYASQTHDQIQAGLRKLVGN
jgi:DNA-binding MarR family transcriptional regulator